LPATTLIALSAALKVVPGFFTAEFSYPRSRSAASRPISGEV